MAKRYKYKPYKTRRKQNDRTLLIIIVLIVVISGGAFWKLKYSNKADDVDDEPGITKIDDLRNTQDPPDRPIPKPEDNNQDRDLPDPDLNKPDQPAETQDNGPKLTEIKPIINVTTDPIVLTKINEALDDATAGYIISARDKLNDILKTGRMDQEVRNRVKLRMSQFADQWLFSNKVLAGDTLTSYYKVSTGDYLSTIGKDHKVPYEFLMRLNNIKDPRSLQAGKNLKVVDGPFRAEVSRSNFTLDIYLGDMFVKTYKVGLGKAQNETPTGLWMVKRGGKLIKPTWTDPDTGKVYVADSPDYPLGSRWIALYGLEGDAKDRTGFAIHGTKEPETIGTRSSRGCIRLHNGEVVEVFNMLVEVDSTVLVKD